ncbi:MAG TPA: cupin domain-containing protein [Candidatus Binatia bacterium]|nr:cupin domain-containing protein [Candidatus Binatia bacterium]
MIANETLEELRHDARSCEADPLWMAYESVSPSDPTPKATPWVWSYRDLRPLLDRAGRLIGTDKAERRVLMLTNPGIGKIPYTTDTLFAGLQHILPGEVARAHRHVAFALRFIIEGERGFTAVGGEKVTMYPGDVILTPNWEYHDHGNESQGPIVWLDGLDIPIYQAFPVHFTRRYSQARYPSKPAPEHSRLQYPWSEMQAKLDAAPGPFAAIEYRHRQTGGPISLTLGAQAERVDRGARSPRRRQTASCVYHVRSGRGRTQVGDVVLEWAEHDTFAVPAWTAFEHENAGNETVYLFRYDDAPVLKAIGAYREEGE